MVDDARHAAGHTTYEVHEVLEGDPAVDLGLRFGAGDFSEAVDRRGHSRSRATSSADVRACRCSR
jgi:anti-sigma factor ChrR (cupin superfamily)